MTATLEIPNHLKKYTVEQREDQYSPIDHAAWRFVLKQLKTFLSVHAHPCYLDGLEKTGVSLEEIPRISDIDKKLQKFGWRAVPVSGFIPPAAFMELQAHSILPIAADMRSIGHLMYTPAPDIVHEAAGHAPILVHPEFAEYLKQYASVAKKAIISQEDLDIYTAIRELSDLKEEPNSSKNQVTQAETKLKKTLENVTHLSEATLLSRMNWWTAEYGLIGDMNQPLIYGAGLLSSAGESQECLGPKVKKIPFSIDCINYSYDITEPQPQLFVAKDFHHLKMVLEELANMMSYRRGGVHGLELAKEAGTRNTIQLDTGLQISGVVSEFILDPMTKEPCFIKTQGPTQLSYEHQELSGHSKEYHLHGYSTPLGKLKGHSKVLSELSPDELDQMGLIPNSGKQVNLEFTSGIKVSGKCLNRVSQKPKLLLLAFEGAHVTYHDKVLFLPEWGTYDMAVGTKVLSVFGGAADPRAFGETMEFVSKQIPPKKYSSEEISLHKIYSEIRRARTSNLTLPALESFVEEQLGTLKQKFPKDWLATFELLELSMENPILKSKILLRLEDLKKTEDQKFIVDGLKLLGLS